MKKLADKNTKELLDENQIKEKGRSKNEFTTSWQGRLTITNVEKSQVAKEVNIKKNGEYAIKIR